MYLYYIRSNRERTNRNALYFTGIPTDLAVALDTIIDGKQDARNGTFRRYPDNRNWPDASRRNGVTVNAMYIIQVP